MMSEDAVRDAVRRAVDEALAVEDSRAPAAGAATGRATSGKIAIGADHGGVALKTVIRNFLEGDLSHSVHDCGTESADQPADYPAIAHAVARQVATGACTWGIVIDGAGIGSAMAANKVPGIRAALCYDLSSARNSREHNLANVLTLGAGLIGSGLAKQIVETWLATPWGDGRHARRAGLITDIEARYLRRNA